MLFPETVFSAGFFQEQSAPKMKPKRRGTDIDKAFIAKEPIFYLMFLCPRLKIL
jgi:hypothetical protein